MRQPKYQLRMDADLLRRLAEAGTTRVREALEQAFPVVPGTTQDAPAVLPDPVTGTTRKATPVLPGTTRAGGPRYAVLPEPVENSPTNGQPLPAWKAKLNEQIDKAKALKAARE